MKITIYTTTDCQFSKQEKDYLNANKLTYEEKNLETNKEFLTEMLAISNNFAGTPVTRVEKDDGSIAVLKGFTKEEFDTTFGFSPAPTASAAPTTPSPTVNETPVEEKPVTETPPAETPVVEAPVIETPPVSASTPPVEPAKSDELNSVMDKLEEKAAPDTPPAEAAPVQPASGDTTTPPSIPDFTDGGKTTV